MTFTELSELITLLENEMTEISLNPAEVANAGGHGEDSPLAVLA